MEDLEFDSISFEEFDSSKTKGFDLSPVSDANPPTPSCPSPPLLPPPPINTNPPRYIPTLTKLVKDVHYNVQRQDDLLKWIFGQMNVAIRKINKLETTAETEAKTNTWVEGANGDIVQKVTNDFVGLADNQGRMQVRIDDLDAKIYMIGTKVEMDEIWFSHEALK